VSAFQVRVFRKQGGYLAWIDGIGTVEGRTLAETRRVARTFIRTVLGGAFPDRPSIDPAGAEEVLQFVVDVRLQRPKRGPGGPGRGVARKSPQIPSAMRNDPAEAEASKPPGPVTLTLGLAPSRSTDRASSSSVARPEPSRQPPP